MGNPQRRPMKTEPAIRKLRPDDVAWLDETARRYYERIVPILDRAGLVTEADSVGLGLLADRYAELMAWRRLVKHEGIAVSASLGYMREMRRCEESYRRYAGEYGLSALSRTRLAFEQSDDDDESDLDTTG